MVFGRRLSMPNLVRSVSGHRVQLFLVKWPSFGMTPPYRATRPPTPFELEPASETAADWTADGLVAFVATTEEAAHFFTFSPAFTNSRTSLKPLSSMPIRMSSW